MKPTPATRQHWSVAGLALAGFALLIWGCGHTREIVYPPREVSPPQVIKDPTAGRKLEPVAPTAGQRSAPASSRHQLDAPTAIDVPIIDRNGR